MTDQFTVDYTARQLHERRHAGVGGEVCPRCERDAGIALDVLPEHAVLMQQIARLEVGLEAAAVANSVLREKLGRLRVVR